MYLIVTTNTVNIHIKYGSVCGKYASLFTFYNFTCAPEDFAMEKEVCKPTVNTFTFEN